MQTKRQYKNKVMRTFLCTILIISAFSCTNAIKNKKGEATTKVPSIKVSNPGTTIPYKQIQGLWGDVSYLENLKKYNSIEKAFCEIEFETELRVVGNHVSGNKPNQMEPNPLDTALYSIEIKNVNFIWVKNKRTKKQQLYRKFNLGEVKDIYGFEPSAIKKMEWLWFAGTYDVLDKSNNIIRTLEFTGDGHIRDYEFNGYAFGTDDAKKGFITLYHDPDLDKKGYKCLLIETKNELLDCYFVKDFDDPYEPLIKSDFAFTLRKHK